MDIEQQQQLNIKLSQGVIFESSLEQKTFNNVSLQIVSKNSSINISDKILFAFNEESGLVLVKQYEKQVKGIIQQYQQKQFNPALNVFISYGEITSVGKSGKKIMIFTGDDDQNQNQFQQQQQQKTQQDCTIEELKKLTLLKQYPKNDINININGNYSICIDFSKSCYEQKQGCEIQLSDEKINQIYKIVSENFGQDDQQSQGLQQEQQQFNMDQMISANDIDQNGQIIKKNKNKKEQHQIQMKQE